MLSDGRDGRGLNAGRWWAATGRMRVVNARGICGFFPSKSPGTSTRAAVCADVSSPRGMSGERGGGDVGIVSGGGGGGEEIVELFRAIAGADVRSAKGSSSKRKSGGGEALGEVTEVGGETTPMGIGEDTSCCGG